MRRNILVFLSKKIRLLTVFSFAGLDTEAGLFSEDLTGAAIFFFILYFFDILP